MAESTQYISQQKHNALVAEREQLKTTKIPEIATKIDEAKQLGDLSENAEYHQAKDDMGWAQGRLREIDYILDHANIIEKVQSHEVVEIGTSVQVHVKGLSKEYRIVGAQEADPVSGKVSNESPLGSALLGRKVGDVVIVEIPSGEQSYTIVGIS
jgi:transcription elongation factor GreA